jgi:hypothetical protein
MNNDTIFERIKEDMRVTAKRALADMDNNFDAVKDNMETALDIVLSELMEQIYK